PRWRGTHRDRGQVRGPLRERRRGAQGLHRVRAAVQQRPSGRRRGRHAPAAQGAIRAVAVPGAEGAHYPVRRDRGGLRMAARVVDYAHGRSGDKGDTCNVGLVAYDDDGYRLLLDQGTAERVKEHYGSLVKGTVTRYEAP